MGNCSEYFGIFVLYIRVLSYQDYVCYCSLCLLQISLMMLFFLMECISCIVESEKKVVCQDKKRLVFKFLVYEIQGYVIKDLNNLE